MRMCGKEMRENEERKMNRQELVDSLAYKKVHMMSVM